MPNKNLRKINLNKLKKTGGGLQMKNKFDSVKSIRDMLDEICSICQNKIFDNFDNTNTQNDTNKNVLASLKCGHIFHKECIDRWFQTKKSCPLCKYRQNELPEEVSLSFVLTNSLV